MLCDMIPLIALTCLVSAPQEPIPITEVLSVESLGVRRRSAVYTDALEARLVRGTFEPPSEGDTIASITGAERTWTRQQAGEDGWFKGGAFRGGWAWAELEVPVSGAWRLNARGHSMVFVDGQPRAGDVYALGKTRIPLALEAGTHQFLFRCGRGRLTATLEPAPGAVYLEEKDRTLPDVVRGEGGTLLMGLIVANAGESVARGYRALVTTPDGVTTATELPSLHASSMRKCTIAVQVPEELEGDQLQLSLQLEASDGSDVGEALELTLPIRDPYAKHQRTFLSEIDGSVQYFAVTPPPAEPEVIPALILTLHGAGVEARGQANAYGQKEWAYIVAPTNRRPFGFDWEDWGRWDTIEVLERAQELFWTDPRRTYLTGHSMGGHGVWQVGAQFPGRFAAIAPSAGWCDFWSYAGGGTFDVEDPLGPMMTRAANASRTGLLIDNYRGVGVYVLHGEADDNVPVREARAMRTKLAEFHSNFAYYERPGAGHWWGSACVDWPPLMAFLQENTLPAPWTELEVEFTTVSPAANSTSRWLSVEAQERWLEPSRARARLKPDDYVLELELENVTRVAIDLAALSMPRDEKDAPLPEDGELRVKLGQQELQVRYGSADATLRLARGADGLWSEVDSLSPGHKHPERCGPFKDAFRRRMVFVYGTAGTPEENAWAFQKARYDHETWRYRGNGAVDVLADVDFEPEDHPDRNVILYGNADTNSAWSRVLEEEAFDLRRGRLRVGERTLEGDDLALLAVHPRKDSDSASVAVIGGTGLPGCRATTGLPYFVSGVAYPDWTVIGAELSSEGLGGVRGAGFFGPDWDTGTGAEAAWR